MQSQQDVYRGEAKLFSSLNVLIFIYLVFLSLVTSRFIEAFSFNQLLLVLLPVALAVAWFGRTWIKRNVVKVSDESISIERSGKEHASIKWCDIQSTEFSTIGRKGLDLFDNAGMLRLHIPPYIERFEELVSFVFERIAAEHTQISRTQYFQHLNVVRDTIQWIVTVALIYSVFIFGNYQETGFVDFFFPGHLGILIVASIFAIHTIYRAWYTPKQLTFHNAHLEITTTLRNTKIPYAAIANAELVGNPWAPVTSKRNFLRIGRKDKAGGYTVRGLESNSEELLATLQKRLAAFNQHRE
ncbi:hypothetical protein CWE13_08500 [Aliidiomarina shirensis]|uniref:Uncharacterized protein n=1 Tax=Aliidiomarina shirensis TaxID=1048642 RepID=A0A432WT06_9GAMM|nr:hypothetical protein [Aliidiomarina shirensis]RUO36877.1 hypothetical protein CWE13_08500 [Aliidiomarina shirensis]